MHRVHFPHSVASLSPQGFFASEVDGHQNFDGNAAAVMAEIVDADYFAEIFAVEGTMSL